MRRVPFLAALLAVAAAALVLGSAPLPTGAQTGTPSAAGQDFVGAWHLTTETPFGPSQSLLIVMADGTVLSSDRPTLPAAGGFPVTFQSAGHGAWQQTGPTTAAATWVEFVSDGQGIFLATVTDSIEATLGADGTSWSGPYSGTVAAPSGTVLFVGGGTIQATRITVQPLATPAAGLPLVGTPAA
jgi:hypothetical protein